MLFSSFQFFQKAGVTEALNVFELFNTVSGLQITSDNEADFLAQVWTSDVYNKDPTHFQNLVVKKQLCWICLQIEALEKRNEDHVQKPSKKIFMDTSEDSPPQLNTDDD